MRRMWTSVSTMGVLLAACASSTGPELCAGGGSPLSHGSCLDLREAGPAATYEELLAREVGRSLERVNAFMAVEGVEIQVVGDPSGVIPEIGLGGFAGNGRTVRLFVDAGRADVEAVLRRELLPLLAHELHHVKRWRTIGYGSTLLEAAVSEGLADHFSVEVAGIAPPLWSVALEGRELDRWTGEALARDGTGYDHSEWFFGRGGIPRWAGYAIGFELVRIHLEAGAGRRASVLFDEPATTFLPR